MDAKIVVITGSTRGLGLGLAESFLAQGCAVVISGRDPQVVEKVVGELAKQHGQDRVAGHACDVTRLEDVQTLWDAAAAHFGRVDVWINNAGLAHSAVPIRELDPQLARSVIETNVIGSIFGSQVAMHGMMAQGNGQIYNMEGYGSRGEVRANPPLSVYGASKYAIRYLTRALTLEAKDTGVQVGTLSPGMLATELVTRQYEDRPQDWERAKRILNVFVERVETVAPWLVERVLANHTNGASIRWLTPLRLAGYFALAPFRKRDVFGPQG